MLQTHDISASEKSERQIIHRTLSDTESMWLLLPDIRWQWSAHTAGHWQSRSSAQSARHSRKRADRTESCPDNAVPAPGIRS